MRGFSHEVLLVVFVVVFAVSGVGYLVASHADSCSAVSGHTCKPVSGAVSGGRNSIISCSVGNIPPFRSHGTGIYPSVTFRNTSKQTVQVHGIANVIFLGDKGTTAHGGPVNATVKAHHSVTVSTGLQYVVAAASPQARRIEFSVNGAPGGPSFACAKVIKLPAF